VLGTGTKQSKQAQNKAGWPDSLVSLSDWSASLIGQPA